MNKINEFKRRDYRRNPRPVDGKPDYVGRVVRKVRKKMSKRSRNSRMVRETAGQLCKRLGLTPSAYMTEERLGVAVKGYALHPSMVRDLAAATPIRSAPTRPGP